LFLARLTTLGIVEVQRVIDACLYEPSLFLHAADSPLPPPDALPAKSDDAYATPIGLLFNEVVQAPTVLLDAVQRLLTLTLELDNGRLTLGSRGCAAILYAIRTAARVESFMRYVLQHAQWLKSGA
jgi:hypothetical protein